ncbi:MAG: FG-GAP-like repeat-containing protein [Candidatus Fermentibacteria bacterium]|nr:FG-GAP-like repeat-containing protein [Candidatus Fermentibacteria bacterium]
MKFISLILISGFCMFAFAESETQTDWVGGPGVAGPVTEWQDEFYLAGDMDWDTTPGQLKLIVNRDENQISTANGPIYVIAIDVDTDGDADAACCAYQSGEIFWSENVDGQGTAWVKHVIGNVGAPRFISVADFDGDGSRDVVVSSDSQNEILLFRKSSSGWYPSTVIASNFDARQVRAADIDGDGMMDIVGVSDQSGDVCWWKNDGFSTDWNQHYVDGALMGAYVCDVGDFNSDGHVDIVAASNSQDDIVAYISKSPFGYSWTKYTINSSYNGPTALAVADYNGDGSDDFAVASSYGDGNLHWYDFLDTQNSWISHDIPGASGQSIYDIVARDMDGDGYPEIMAASLGEDQIIWCKNREYLGENWETFSVSTYFQGAAGVSVGDMDGDGVHDVLGCAFYGDKISWWRVSGFTTPSILTSSILNIEPPDPGSVVWDYIHWSSTTPDGTAVRFRLKTSYDAFNMGGWSTWITSSSSLGSVVSQGGQFLQYQVELSTSNPNTTPSLKDVSILWTPVSIEDQGTAPVDGRRIWLSSGNPVSGAFSVGYNVEQPGFVSVAVYDVTGRTVSVISNGEMAAGQYSGMVTGLSAGTYSVVMQSDQGFAAQRIVVIR